jgi:hypothetical protein
MMCTLCSQMLEFFYSVMKFLRNYFEQCGETPVVPETQPAVADTASQGSRSNANHSSQFEDCFHLQHKHFIF